MSKTIVVVSCLAVTAVLIAACVLCQTPVDRSLLTGDPCEPPCWQGLTPGESTLEDVNEFMRTSGFVSPLTVHRSALRIAGGERVGLSIWWQSNVWGAGGSNNFDIHGGVLDSITIHPHYDVTLGRLINRYGPPEKYVAFLPIGGPLYYDVTLYYPAHGFTVHLALRYDDPTLRPETGVGSVWYFRAAPLEQFLELRREQGYSSSTPHEALQYMHDWQGYGAIDLD